jgi:antirestriction protein ArdC
MAKKKVDVFEVVNTRILEALEKGVVPWKKPWHSSVGFPRSMSTRKTYRGANIFILGITALMEGYESPWWGTFNQIGEKGGKVLKGEHPTPVVFWKPIQVEPKEGDEETEPYTIWLHRYYNVWNENQTEGLELKPLAEVREEFDIIERAEQVVDLYLKKQKLAVKRYHKAAYSPTKDEIYMPARETFINDNGWYSTLAHEVAHSTGHETRLKRKIDNVFGDHKYSFEELVAEFTAAMFCYEVGIEEEIEQSAAYIQSWLKALEGNKRWLVDAGGKAQKAFEFIFSEEKKGAENGN